MGSLSLLQGIFPNLGIEPRFPALQADSLPAESQGKSKNTGVGSLSLLQWISDPGIELGSLALQADSLPTELCEKQESYDKPRQCIEKQRHHFAQGSPVGCHPWGCTKLDKTEVT